jgi:ribonuclease-3
LNGPLVKPEPSLIQLQDELGYNFSDRTLLVCCLTHVSYERGQIDGHNEVLEFLGDAVLDLAVSELLIRHYPEKSEGDLSRMRADLVNSDVLAEKANRLHLGTLLRVGKGEERSGGRAKASILAGAFEALIGAVFRDGGYGAALDIIERYFTAELCEKELGQRDYKTRLQEISQMLFRQPPSYRIVAESGPDHAKQFVTEIVVGGKTLGRGEGFSKKQSEQAAAQQALQKLQQSESADDC